MEPPAPPPFPAPLPSSPSWERVGKCLVQKAMLSGDYYNKTVTSNYTICVTMWLRLKQLDNIKMALFWRSTVQQDSLLAKWKWRQLEENRKCLTMQPKHQRTKPHTWIPFPNKAVQHATVGVLFRPNLLWSNVKWILSNSRHCCKIVNRLALTHNSYVYSGLPTIRASFY